MRLRGNKFMPDGMTSRRKLCGRPMAWCCLFLWIYLSRPGFRWRSLQLLKERHRVRLNYAYGAAAVCILIAQLSRRR
jgi:hypothetical protein